MRQGWTQRSFQVFLLLALALTAARASELLTSFEKNSVKVEVFFEEETPMEKAEGTLRAVFTPAPHTPSLHLYDKDLQGTLGIATKLEIAPGQPARAVGALQAAQKPHELNGLSVYPEGSVELSLPIILPRGNGAKMPVELRLSYMACTDSECLPPVINRAVTVELPSVRRVSGKSVTVLPSAGAPVAADADAVREVVREELAHVRTMVAEEIAKGSGAHGGIHWQHPRTPAEAERMVADAHAAGKSALLDFTGPSCSNCQLMAKTVFRLPAVIAAWNAHVPVEVNTDPPFDDLASWQEKTFGTQSRPLYVRWDQDGKQERWSQVFSEDDSETLAKFLAFLQGGAGADAGLGANAWEFLILAILGGLFTLVMPCTYPMIPFTVNFFAKQAAGGKRIMPLALAFSFGIVACFTGIGVLVVGILHKNLATLAGHPVTNLIFALLFIVLGLSLMGAFLLRLPASFGSVGGGRAGYLGALIMGLTFAVTAFSCTAPFAGTVLSQAVATGTWTSAVLGMMIYSATIAIPFFFLAMSPGVLARLPKAGEWMNEFKVVGGLIEFAAAFKFLAICDNAWNWGLIGRASTLSIWAVLSAVIGAYTLGQIRMHDDQPVRSLGVGRLLIACAFLILALWLAAGLFGQNLGVVESWFPRDAAP